MCKSFTAGYPRFSKEVTFGISSRGPISVASLSRVRSLLASPSRTMAHGWLFPVLLSVLLTLVSSQDADYWNTQAQQTLTYALRLQPNHGVAKNVVFFLGDGMDITTTTAARIYRGQVNGGSGEEDNLSWDEFPYVALSKTYNTDQQVGDSAGTATAFLCGVKSKAGTLGVDDRVERSSCSSILGAEVDSLLVQANTIGKATGFISTARVTHATPGALYAHSPERNWEIDGDIPEEEAELGCKDIARQLIDDNDFINVILGGGRRNFLPNTTADPEYAHINQTGSRTDDINLVDRWLSAKGQSSARYVWNQTAFDEVDVINTQYLLGLFEPSHMQYESARSNDTGGEPSIADMTEKAIRVLQRDPDGFFLMIEGGRIDHAHHDGIAIDAFKDTIAFDAAVAKAIELTDKENTLIIVTADHGHAITIGGYPERGNPILGYDNSQNGTDGLPYLTITYANGPGGIALAESYNRTGSRPNYLNHNTEEDGFQQDAAIPLSDETHGGADVAIYALGPWAHLFHSTHEQNYIPHVVRYAACYVEDEDNACNAPQSTVGPCTGKATSLPSPLCSFLLSMMTFTMFLLNLNVKV